MYLIPVKTRVIGETDRPTCNARDLHEYLQVGRDFTNWIKGRIQQYGFVEGKDYLLAKTGEQVPHQGGERLVEISEYIITTDMAKELAMVERNDRGRQAREYFIECEKQLHEMEGMFMRRYLKKSSRLPVPHLDRYQQSEINRHAASLGRQFAEEARRYMLNELAKEIGGDPLGAVEDVSVAAVIYHTRIDDVAETVHIERTREFLSGFERYSKLFAITGEAE